MYNEAQMYKGGPNHTPQVMNLIRYTGLFVPLLIVAYGIVCQLDPFLALRSATLLSFAMLSFWWVFIAVVQFFFPSRSKVDSALRLIAYHLLAGAYLIFVTGIATPFVALWILLLIASNAFFSRTGLGLSILWFVLMVATDIVLWSSTGTQVAVYDLATLVAILLSGLVTLSLAKTQESSRRALHHSRSQQSFQRDRIDTIVNNITDAIISTDRRGLIQLYNAATLNLLDTNENLKGKSIDDVLKLMGQDKKPLVFSEELAKQHATMVRDDIYFTFGDGEQIRLEITYSPIRSSYNRSRRAETHEGYMMIMRDVTKSKSLEEERDEFISVVSHELRTPITIMEGSLSNLQLMMQEKIMVKPGALLDATKVAHDQSIYLAKMVNDLSTLSRAERGVADSGEDIDIKALLHKMHDEYDKDARAKKLHLNLDLSSALGTVHVSRLYLEELLQNFITNAIKYTKEGTVTITASATKNHVTIVVKDTGIGMSRSDQQKIFQKFYRSEDYRIRETSGTGLGLYVAQKLAHKIGTKIVMTSRLNHGSSFSFSLPLIADNK